MCVCVVCVLCGCVVWLCCVRVLLWVCVFVCPPDPPPPDTLPRTLCPPPPPAPPPPDPPPPDHPKCRAFVFLSRPHFRFFLFSLSGGSSRVSLWGSSCVFFSLLWGSSRVFFSSLWGSSRVFISLLWGSSRGNFGGVWSLGLSHDSPRTPNVHIWGSQRFKHHQNSTRIPPQSGERKKNAKFWTPRTCRPPPFGPPQFGPPTLSALLLFSGFGPTLISDPTTISDPWLTWSKQTHVRDDQGTSSNWAYMFLLCFTLRPAHLRRNLRKKTPAQQEPKSQGAIQIRIRLFREHRAPLAIGTDRGTTVPAAEPILPSIQSSSAGGPQLVTWSWFLCSNSTNQESSRSTCEVQFADSIFICSCVPSRTEGQKKKPARLVRIRNTRAFTLCGAPFFWWGGVFAGFSECCILQGSKQNQVRESAPRWRCIQPHKIDCVTRYASWSSVLVAQT